MVSSAAVWLLAATATATATVAAAATPPTLLQARLLPYAGDAVRVAVDVRNALPLSVSVAASWLGCCPLASGGACAGALQTLNAAPASHTATPLRGGGGAARFEYQLAAADLAAMAAVSSGGGGRCVVAYNSAATGSGGGGGVPREASFSFDVAMLVSLRRAATDPAAPPRVARNTSVSGVWGSGGGGGTPPDPTTDAGCLAAFGPLRGHRGSGGCVSPPRRSVKVTAAPPPTPPPVDTPVPGGTESPPDYTSGGNALLDVLEDAVEPFVVRPPSCGSGGNATWHAGAQRCVGCASGAACGLPGCGCNARASGDAVAALGVRCNNGRFSYKHQACVCEAGWSNAADSVPRLRFCDVAQPPRVVTLPGVQREAELSHNPAVLLGQVWGAAPRRCLAVTALLVAACAVAAVAAAPALRMRFTRVFLRAMRDGGRLSHEAWQVMDQEIAASLARRRQRRMGDEAASSDDGGTGDGDDDDVLPPWQQATLQAEIPPDWSLEEHRAELRAAAGTPPPSSSSSDDDEDEDEDEDEAVAVDATGAGLPRYAADAAGRSGYLTELYSTAASIHTAWTSAPPTPMLGRIKGTEPINESELHRHPDASVVFDALPFVEDDGASRTPSPAPSSSPEDNAETRRRARRVRRTMERE